MNYFHIFQPNSIISLILMIMQIRYLNQIYQNKVRLLFYLIPILSIYPKDCLRYKGLLTSRVFASNTRGCHGNTVKRNTFPLIRYFFTFSLDSTDIKVDHTSKFISVAILFGFVHFRCYYDWAIYVIKGEN